jgi:hypothetical protein
MGKSKRNAPVVIVRKDKRLNKTGHVAAFLLTGGTSSVYTAAKATTNAGYNARTRALQAASEGGGGDQSAAGYATRGARNWQQELALAVGPRQPGERRRDYRARLLRAQSDALTAAMAERRKPLTTESS